MNADYIMEFKGINDSTYKIIGAAIGVHNHLGCGFLEAVYQEALEIEFINQNIFYEREFLLPVYYRQVQLNTFYKSDFMCFKKVIVELKAVKQITSVHESQIINYLKSSGLNVGLLINFGNTKLEYKRFVHNYKE